MRLLVIEDEPDLLNGLARALRRAGYSVDTAPDGEEGLFKAREIDYDAIVLDVMLPVLDGWTVLARLREKKDTPVLMLTSLGSLDDILKGLKHGANGYLTKPAKSNALVEAIKKLLV